MDETVKQLLTNVRVAAPCAERWDGMCGSDQIRSCERCGHKVYNLSEMTAPEAADLLRNVEGRLCVRFYRRADGTMMTKDCPVGLRAVRQRMARGIGIAFASLLTLSAFNLRGKPRSEYPFMLRLLADRIAPEPAAEPAVMGDIAVAMPIRPKPSPNPLPELPTAKTNSYPRHYLGLHVAEDYNGPVALGIPDLLVAETAEAEKTAQESVSAEKPFLVGLTVVNEAPREDPFVKLPRGKKASR